jgi:hypothetical protein
VALIGTARLCVPVAVKGPKNVIGAACEASASMAGVVL